MAYKYTVEEAMNIASAKFESGEQFIVSEIYDDALEGYYKPHGPFGKSFDRYVEEHPETIKRVADRKVGNDSFAQYEKL